MEKLDLSKEVLENAIGVHRSLEGIEPLQPLDTVAVQAMEQLLEYQAIGTVEELQQAKERMKPKKVIIWADGTEHCPNCDCDNSCIGYGVCIDCGQKLDWSE